MLKISRANFDHVGAMMDFELEDGTMLHSSEWTGEKYITRDGGAEVEYIPVTVGIGDPDEDGAYAWYETIGFERR